MNPQQKKEFLKDESINPLTGRKITIGGPTHTLLKRDMIVDATPKSEKRRRRKSKNDHIRGCSCSR